MLIDELKKRGMTVGTAESCTGGLVADYFVKHDGVSSVYIGGAVTYSNEMKVKMLDVSEDTLQKYGAVSEQTAVEMVNGICKVTNADVCISTTGIAGSGGGTKEKPVGLVYIAVKVYDNIVVKKYNIDGSRNEVRKTAVDNAVELALEMLKR